MGACCERGPVDKLVNDVGTHAVKVGGEGGGPVEEACSETEGPVGQWWKFALKGRGQGVSVGSLL